MVEWFAGAVGVKKGTLIAAFLGALASLPFIRSPYEDTRQSAMYKVFILICGTAGAVFVAPLIVEALEVKAEYAIVFLTGAFFMSFASAFHRVLVAVDYDSLTNFAASLIKGKK